MNEGSVGTDPGGFRQPRGMTARIRATGAAAGEEREHEGRCQCGMPRLHHEGRQQPWATADSLCSAHAPATVDFKDPQEGRGCRGACTGALLCPAGHTHHCPAPCFPATGKREQDKPAHIASSPGRTTTSTSCTCQSLPWETTRAATSQWARRVAVG